MTGNVESSKYSGPGPGEMNSPPVSENQNSVTSTNDCSSPFRHNPFQPFVDIQNIPSVTNSPSKKNKKCHSKSIEEIKLIIDAGKVRELKHVLRNSHWTPFDPIRSRLWQVLCSSHTKDNATMGVFYWDTVKQIYGSDDLQSDNGHLPTFVEPTFQISYYLNHTGIQMARRIVTIISYSCPDITYAPSLYPITCILLHYLSEEECYTCLSWMVTSKATKFITQTKLHFETIWRTAMMLSRKHVKSAVSYISKQVGVGVGLEAVHQNWLWCILKELPFQHLIRIMDCFLFEGRKVMYRAWMAILILFHRHSTALSPSSGSTWSKEAGAVGVEVALENFCRNIPCSPEKLLKTAYGIRNFRSLDMDRLFIKTEMYLKSKTASALASSTPNATLGPRSRSSDVLPTSQSQINVQMVSHTLTIRELLTLWSWLPVRITMYQPELLYTTEEHGCSMTTFFARVETHEPTILIVKTTTEEVFGAYCSTQWGERKMKDCHGGRQGYFGTGETFVFTLIPEKIKYPWVGIKAANSPDGPACVRHAAELFMASDGHMITIGGGKGQAIWIDENIRHGKTERSLTFNNPPLCSTMDFEIRVLEVYGFAGT